MISLIHTHIYIYIYVNVYSFLVHDPPTPSKSNSCPTSARRAPPSTKSCRCPCCGGMKKSKGQLRGSQSSMWPQGGWSIRFGGGKLLGVRSLFLPLLWFTWIALMFGLRWFLGGCKCCSCRSLRNFRRWLLLSSLSLSSLSNGLICLPTFSECAESFSKEHHRHMILLVCPHANYIIIWYIFA